MMRHAMTWSAALFAVALLLLAPGPAVAVEQTSERADAAVSTGLQDFSFASLDVDFTLTRDDAGESRLQVVETFVAQFPDADQNRGMRRSIPDSYFGAPLHPTLRSVTDENGTARPVETESDDGYLVITSAADDFVHGAQTYVFTYTLENVTRFFADTGVDEFYWDVLGEEWAQPFGRATLTMHLDPALAAAMTGEQACYYGDTGATTQCGIEVVTEADGSATSTVRRRWLRDEPGRPTIIAEYTPPPDIDALESAVLLGQVTKAIPAEVLEQAVVGSIRIIEGKARMFGGAKLEAQLIDPALADGDGRMLLDGLFGPELTPGATYEFGRTDTRFSTAAQSILKAADQELTTRGLRRPVRGALRAWPSIAAVGAGAATFAFGVAALVGFVSWIVPVMLMILGALVIFVVPILLLRKPLTAAGAETRDHLAGLQEFIRWAEEDRIRMLQSPSGAERVPVDVGDPRQMLELYEVLLPYAVVFGQEKEWAAQLAVYYGSSAPGWYVGTHGFNAAAFSSGISTLSTTSSSSSGSGGSSGGGGAGGGGGGGGGGGV